jgi:hypothetical protein
MPWSVISPVMENLGCVPFARIHCNSWWILKVGDLSEFLTRFWPNHTQDRIPTSHSMTILGQGCRRVKHGKLWSPGMYVTHWVTTFSIYHSSPNQVAFGVTIASEFPKWWLWWLWWLRLLTSAENPASYGELQSLRFLAMEQRTEMFHEFKLATRSKDASSLTLINRKLTHDWSSRLGFQYR